ncbi:hypothetical protein F5Y08DRAFT_322805 [Xylaria arbuscula]|nr:hypothetical protein F5Y08DRAFT_322805 [Xylaria arbuscula]
MKWFKRSIHIVAFLAASLHDESSCRALYDMVIDSIRSSSVCRNETSLSETGSMHARRRQGGLARCLIRARALARMLGTL